MLIQKVAEIAIDRKTAAFLNANNREIEIRIHLFSNYNWYPCLLGVDSLKQIFCQTLFKLIEHSAKTSSTTHP